MVMLVLICGFLCISCALGDDFGSGTGISTFGSGTGCDPFTDPFCENQGEQCGQGYHYDYNTGTCVPDNQGEQCGQGYHYDYNAATCVPDNQEEENPQPGVLLYAGTSDVNLPEPTISGLGEPNDATAFNAPEMPVYSTNANNIQVLSQQGTSPNAFWIVNKNGLRMQTMTIPLNWWAREEILPAVSGRLVLFERYPGGRIVRFYPGTVNRGGKYRMWFGADVRGRHDVVYWVNSPRGWFNSNIIHFDVT